MRFHLLTKWLPVVAAMGAATSCGAQAPEPAMQLAPDAQAYKAANEIVDPTAHIAALKAFLRDFPESKRDDAARKKIFQLMLTQPHPDKRAIHELAMYRISHAKASDKTYEEYYVADSLAEAPPNGIDLKSAEGWAQDAVNSLTLAAFTAQMKESYAKYKEPMASDEEIHRQWANYRAYLLQTLADVYYHEGKLKKASQALEEGKALDPTVGALWLTQGQIAHEKRRDVEALDELELAEVYGGVTPAGKDLLKQVYAASHHGDGSGLEAELDQRYGVLRKPLTVTPHAVVEGGRSLLVELFTGSACDPCVAADLALDGVLKAYPRDEVVALSFDMHIPEPDPLANPDTIARGEYNSVGGTPTMEIDGRGIEGHVYGQRADAEGAYEAAVKALDAELKTPSGVVVKLTAQLNADHTIAAEAKVNVIDAAALKSVLTTPAKKDAAAAPASEGKLVLNFALVQREVRYSGENGIRFHSMVVRQVAKPAAEGLPVASSGASTGDFRFDPSAVSAGLSKYLADYAEHSAQFGTVHFLMNDTSLPLDQLGVAAWVEDPKTHHVVAAAYAPVSAGAQEAAR